MTSPRRPTLPARGVLHLIQAYRVGISPLLGPTCRYAPSCSEYALIAVQRFGAGRGGWLALRRLLRCGPWHRGGYDPVPDRPVSSAGPVRTRSVDDLTKPELEPQL